MQTFKVLFFSPILSFFFVWAHRNCDGVKHVYHVILTLPYTWLQLFLSDPSVPMSVCWKIQVDFPFVYHQFTLCLWYTDHTLLL